MIRRNLSIWGLVICGLCLVCVAIFIASVLP